MFKNAILLVVAFVCASVEAANTVTVTQTVVATTTVTVPAPCPTGPATCPEDAYTSVNLNFDDVACGGICPFPGLTYHNFTFNGASGWLLTDAAHAPDSRAVTTSPNALLTMSSGPVDFGSAHAGFTFDVLRFSWSVFSNDANTDVIFFMNGVQSNGNTRSYSTHVQSGIDTAPYLLDLSGPHGQLTLDFSNLIKLDFAAYTSYDPATKTGMPATIVFDSFTLRKHADPCNV